MKHILITTLAILWAATQLVAQDLIVPKKGNPITAYNIEASGSFIYYTAESDANAALLRIAKDSVLMVRKADGTAMDFTAAPTIQQTILTFVEPQKTDYPDIDEADIHGSLIAKGNKVFIPTNSYNESERAGQEQLKKCVSEWDYWIVVDRPEQAHFVLQYVVTTKGFDWAWLFIRPRKYYKYRPSIELSMGGGSLGKNVGVLVCNCTTDDSNSQVNQVIVDVFFNHLKGMLTEPNYEDNVDEPYKQASKQFKNQKSQKCLDADNDTNDYGYGSFSYQKYSF